MNIAAINLWAVIVASFGSFVLGAIWYSKLLFGPLWQRKLGFTDEYIQQANMGMIFGSSFVMILIQNAVLAAILQGHYSTIDMLDQIDAVSGLLHGLLLGVGFIATSYATNMLYQRRGFAVWAIDAGYQVTYLTLAGFLFAVWK